jgi:hypothetical protein
VLVRIPQGGSHYDEFVSLADWLSAAMTGRSQRPPKMSVSHPWDGILCCARRWHILAAYYFTGRTRMSEYLLIESRDPFESNDVGYYYELARGLRESGNLVTLLLVQNGVLAARPSAQAPGLIAIANAGVKILADDFALKERGITKLRDGVQVAPIDVVVDHLEAGHKTLWH